MTDEHQIPEVPGFELIRKVGEGGMSTVWEARECATSHIYAVKLLSDDFSASDQDRRQFREESLAMQSINHPGIVKSTKFDEYRGKCYFVMEFVDGYNFGQLLARKQHLNESDCLLICQSVAAALDYAWNEHGIVHCDIKPENLMINSSGEIKITDLGLCHTFSVISNFKTEKTSHVYGTPAYISPEQVYGDVQPDCRADIYSLAATLYHLSTGRVLFPNLDADASMRAHCSDTAAGKDPRVYRPSLSLGFCQMLEAMLVKDRDFRISGWNNVYDLALDVENELAFTARAGSSPSSLKLSL